MAQKKIEVSVYPDDRAERLAHIMGPSSAAAMALVELKKRREAGEDAVLLIAGSMILVGPRPALNGAN